MDDVDAVRASRSRLVRADDDDRRAIERDLHDGLQQQLVALGVNLQLAQLLTREEDGELRGLLEELAAGSQSAIRWTKYALNNWLRLAGPTFDASLALEFMGFGGPDVREGIASLRGKRPPSFSGPAPE